MWVDAGETQELATHLGLAVSEFNRRYVRQVGRLRSLIDKPDRTCIFWDGRCTVYSARPGQCRTFPFWEQNLENEGAWEAVRRRCRGAGSGQLYSLNQIRRLSGNRGATEPGPQHTRCADRPSHPR